MVCYTAAWIDIIVPYALNLIGLIVASIDGRWLLHDLYRYGYYPLALAVVLATVFDWTPRARATPSAKAPNARGSTLRSGLLSRHR